MSCTAPAKTPPIKIQRKPGRYPNCAAKTGPIKGPAPAIAAKWGPKINHLLVGIYSSSSFKRWVDAGLIVKVMLPPNKNF
jgi:hypothetical protein